MERMIIAAVLAGLQAVLVLFLLYTYKILSAGHGKKKITLYSVMIVLPAVCMYYQLQEKSGFSILQAADHFFVFSLLIVLAIIDYRFYKIPNRLLFFGVILRLILLIPLGFSSEGGLKACIYLAVSMVVCLIVMLLLSFFSKRGIGFGDVKLFALLGFWFGLKETYFILFYSILLAALAGVFLIGIKKGNRKTKIPFAPFILVGYYIVILIM